MYNCAGARWTVLHLRNKPARVRLSVETLGGHPLPVATRLGVCLSACCVRADVVDLATSVACKTATPRNDAEWYAPCVHRWQASCRKHVGCRRGPTACAVRLANWMAPVWHEAGTLSLRHGGSRLWRTHDGQACHHRGLFARTVGGRVATGSKRDRG